MLMLAVQANCEDCGEPFVFHDMEVLTDVPDGMLRYASHVSSDGQTVFHPIAVASDCHLVKENMN